MGMLIITRSELHKINAIRGDKAGSVPVYLAFDMSYIAIINDTDNSDTFSVYKDREGGNGDIRPMSHLPNWCRNRAQSLADRISGKQNAST